VKPTTPDDVLDLLDASFPSAALGAAMELGLFWLLDAQPLDAPAVARTLGIPPVRCAYWLQFLLSVGLIEQGPRGYQPSRISRSAILETYSQNSWALLAEEARGRLPGLCDLPVHIRDGGSAWEGLRLTPPMFYDRMEKEPETARRFTRMLYELHQPLANELAGFLDLSGAQRLMDLGGGSGAVSIAIAQRYPALRATVVDIPNVCAAGREIAAVKSLAKQIIFQPADFLQDALPTGFDVVLECDVNIYSEALFLKIRDSLNPNGRFFIVDQFAPAEGSAPSARLHWAFEGSMISPGFMFPTVAKVRDMLEKAGFAHLCEAPLPVSSAPCRRFTDGFFVIEANR